MFPNNHVLPQPIMTRHACIRAQQRGIPSAVRDALLDFGDRRRAGRGAETVYFTKKSWKNLQLYMGNEITKAFEKYRNCYLIASDDGCIITEAFRS